MPKAAGLLALKRISVSRGVLDAALRHLRDAGEAGYEGLALWAGTITGADAEICETIIPRQRAIRSEFGLCVLVDAEELHNLNVHLFETGRRLIVQVHSHGETAYHSEADDRYSVVTGLGAVSIVVPYFAAERFRLRQCAVYRLQPDGWTRLSDQEADVLLDIEEE